LLASNAYRAMHPIGCSRKAQRRHIDPVTARGRSQAKVPTTIVRSRGYLLLIRIFPHRIPPGVQLSGVSSQNKWTGMLLPSGANQKVSSPAAYLEMALQA